MRVLILDDNEKDLYHIRSLFNEFSRLHHFHIDIVTETNVPDITEIIKNFDIVMLDIELKEQNGIAIACEIRKLSRDIRIIFVSNYNTYLLDGYKASANLYLLKPIHQTHFNIEMEAIAWKYLYYNKAIYQPKIYPHKIYVKDILYIEILQRKTIIHMQNQLQIDCYYSLKRWMEILEDAPFGQPHRSFYVNLSYIKELKHKHLTLQNDQTISITDIYRQSFQKDYLRYRNREL